MPITDQDIADLLTTTHYNMRKGKFTDISQELNDYLVMPYLIKKNKGLIIKKNGIGIEQTLMHTHGGRSRWVGEYDEDVYNVIDHLKKMQLNWCLLNDSLAYTRSEVLENRGEARINNVILPRRRALYLRVAETMEDAFFAAPDVDDDLTPWGLLYWIVKNASAGFNGGYPSGFSRIANINLSEVPAFKNYTDNYDAVTKGDLITKLRRAHRRTKWKSPKPMKQFEGDTSPRRTLLTNEDTVEAFEDIGEAQNDNLGRDLAPMNTGSIKGLQKTPDGEIMFKRHPITYVPHLDNDTSDPVYMIDLDTFHALAFAGDNMRLSDFSKLPLQHRVFGADLDHKMQFLCDNRRNNAVIAKMD